MLFSVLHNSGATLGDRTRYPFLTKEVFNQLNLSSIGAAQGNRTLTYSLEDYDTTFM